MVSEYTLDFINLQFPEVFLRFFGSNRYLPYFLKCIGIGFVAWIPGLLVTYFSGTFSIYISDFIHFVWDIGAGISLFFLVFLLRRIDSTLHEVDNLVKHSEDKSFLKFVWNWNNSSAYWYYLCAMGPFVYWLIGDILHIFVPSFPHGPFPSWVDEESLVKMGFSIERSWDIIKLNTFYLGFEHVIVGLIMGIGFNRLLHYLLFIKDYNKSFLSKKRLDLLFQDAVAGLRPLGRLALESSLVITLPLLLASLNFFAHWIERGRVSNVWLLSVIGIAFVLIVTVIFQVMYPRQALLNAKKEANHSLMAESLNYVTRLKVIFRLFPLLLNYALYVKV